MSARYLTGEIVDITIKGARVRGIAPYHEHSLLFEYLVDDRPVRSDVYLTAKSVTVERVAPPAWPPLPGDLWTDSQGQPWFAYDATDLDDAAPGTRVRFQSVSTYSFGTDQDPAEVNQRYGPMSLTHRPRASCSGWLGCECTHGADCKIHPLVGGPHSFDSECCKGTGWSWADGASVPCEDLNCPVPAEHRTGTAGTR